MRTRIHNSKFLIPNFVLAGLGVLSWGAKAQSPPEGAGKKEFDSVCSLCHDGPTAVMGKQWTRAQWDAKVAEMLQEETDVTPDERTAIADYLAANFKPGGPIYVNKSSAKDLVASLNLTAKDAEALVRYRESNGAFKTADALKQVPQIDTAKIDDKKDRLIFQ